MIKHPKIELKAMKAKEVPFEKLVFPMLAQLKFDGVRLITCIEDDMPTFYTYNGSTVELPALREQILQAQLGNMMLDGEIVFRAGSVNTRTTVSGMINSAIHGNRINERSLSYTIFDGMPLEMFKARKCDAGYKERYSWTITAANQAHLVIARNMTVHSPDHVEELSAQLYADGFEGLILKPFDHKYYFSRNKNWVKIKETKSADLLCIDTTPGTGKYEGMIGALVCRGLVENKIVTVKVGSGFNDAQRDQAPSIYIDKIIEVKYNSVIQDSRTGEWSLFLPRFVAVRFDK
jgi:DNA ligase-1